MIIIIDNRNSVTIQVPGLGVFVEVDVRLGTSDHDFGLFCIKLQLVAFAIMADNEEGTLESTRSVGEHIGVIRDTDCSDAKGANAETKLRVWSSKDLCKL